MPDSKDYDAEEYVQDTKNEHDEMEEISGQIKNFKTGEVASMVGETPAMIRHYCTEFAEFLNFEHNPGTHRLFSQHDIAKLKFVIDLIRDKNLNTRQVKEYLSSPEGKMLVPYQTDDERFSKLADYLSKKIRSDINEIITSDLIDEITNKVVQQVSKSMIPIETNTSEINKKLNDIQVNQDKSFDRINHNIEDSVSRVDKFISEFRENSKKKKHKGLFGFFKKET